MAEVEENPKATVADQTNEGGAEKSASKDRFQTSEWRKLAEEEKQNGGSHKDRSARNGNESGRDRRDRRDRSPRGRGGRGGRGRGAGRGRGGRGGSRNDRNGDRPQRKIRMHPELEETDDPEEIRKQVEFYFSDSNIFVDKHLLTQINGHENKPYPIKELCTFSRMRRFQPYTAVVAALKESEQLNVLDDGKPGDECVQRKVPVPEDTSLDVAVNRNKREDQTLLRSIYAKGFGEETPTTQQEIMDFFDPYGPIKQVRLRRDERDGHFKGSVFVEFADDETQQTFLNLESKPQWRNKDLQIMSKKEYTDTKNKMIDNGEIRPKSPPAKGRRGGRDRLRDPVRKFDRVNDEASDDDTDRLGRQKRLRDDENDESERNEAKKAKTVDESAEKNGESDKKDESVKTKTDESVENKTEEDAGTAAATV